MIFRVFVEKKEQFAVAAKKTKKEIKTVLRIDCSDVRSFIRYDVDAITQGEFNKVKTAVFSEPPIDIVYEENLPELEGYKVFAVEYLPGQYDQRADSAAQCVQFITHKNRPLIKTATVYAIKGVDEVEFEKIKGYLINTVESQEAAMQKPTTLESEIVAPAPIELVAGFVSMTKEQIQEYHSQMGFAMSIEDLLFVQNHFSDQMRNPTVTELKILDTYWSDHCRHTTFLTALEKIKLNTKNPHIKDALEQYNMLFQKHHYRTPSKPRTLMDLATMGARELKSRGKLLNLDESEEINACSIAVQANVNGKPEDWLVMFKNETHNHPTEIEPYGGAATCLGGAIRDPLSGRSYVYQSMRITGAADITADIDKTLSGKLPQRVISTGAASGFSSYGNQIGLATGIVNEVFHEGYAAKRLETGFVVGAAPYDNVLRFVPQPDDLIMLIGGETGRDGCGGATGSSKAHTAQSVEMCGAEVQKGNPLTERKIQRLFRNPEMTRLIKRCNDFGAGGVCVAIGELAAGLDIYLDLVPRKYDGLNGTEIAISESQERMAIVVRPEDENEVHRLCREENLAAAVVAKVTDKNRMRMFFENKLIVDLDRELLSSNGVRQTAEAIIKEDGASYINCLDDKTKGFIAKKNYKQAILNELSRLNVCSQKGLAEMFDSTIGAGTVLMPFGGHTQLTPSISMAAKLPVSEGEADTATVCSWGFNPHLMSEAQFTGAVYSVLLSVIKVAISGGYYDSIRLTFQEYFERLKKDPNRWGKPTAALLGALYAQLKLELPAIGGKDSMSGSFEKIDVPPTLISFALGISSAQNIISNVFDEAECKIYLLPLKRDKFNMPDLEYAAELVKFVQSEIYKGNIKAATIVEEGGAVAAVVKSCLGNELGFEFKKAGSELFEPRLGDIIVQSSAPELLSSFRCTPLGKTTKDGNFVMQGQIVSFEEAKDAFCSTLEAIYPNVAAAEGEVENLVFNGRAPARKKTKGKKKVKQEETDPEKISALKETAKPRVFIPVFPGTNCEIDTARRFVAAGAVPQIFVIKNQSPEDIDQSIEQIVKLIYNSQIIAFPGGFSGGDEPDGSAKFIAATFKNPKIKEAVYNLLKKRDGLILGICNGFQALVKLGLLPFGEIKDMTQDSPTLTFNNIGRHISTVSRIRVSSTLSPWFLNVKTGQEYAVAISHGEGKFVATKDDLDKLIKNGQICTQYVDNKNNATMLSPFNPNGSLYAIEGITSPDGRILGKMGHSERIGENIMKNIALKSDMKIFEAGVKYFK